MIKIDQEESNPIFQSVAQALFSTLSLKGNIIVEIDMVSEAQIKEINRQFRGVDNPTDVLSFPSIDKITFKTFSKLNYPYDYDSLRKGVVIGSIVICKSIAARQAEEYSHSLTREMAYLCLHGLLHLLGYDHMEENDKIAMRKCEEKVLAKVGITRED